MSRARFALALGLTLLLGGCGKMFGFRRGGPEPPPKGIGDTPAPGYAVRLLPSAQAVSDYCRAWGVGTGPDDYNAHMTGGCVIPGLKAEVLPSPEVVGKDLFPAYQRHENAHTYNLVHGADGEGWYRNGPVPQGVDPKLAALLMTLPATPIYAAQLARPMTTQTAAVVPAKPPGLMGASARGQ